MGEQTTTRAKKREEPIYEIKVNPNSKYCELIAEVRYDCGHADIGSGRYRITDLTYLGHQKILWRNERGYIEREELEKLISEVEEGLSQEDIHGQPFFVNGFMFTRRTGMRRYDKDKRDTLFECPIEFSQVEVDLKSRLDT